MLKEEIKLLLGKVEREVLTFVVYIKDIEIQHGGFYYRGEKQEHQDSSANKPIHPNFSIDGKNTANGSSIVDAFNLVKNVLQKFCNLLDEISSLPTEDEKNLSSSHSYKERLYYTQYVYQISSYLITVLLENLKSFSEKLDRLASSKFQTKEQATENPIKVPVYHASKQRKKMAEPHAKFNIFRTNTVYPGCKVQKQPDLRSYRYHFPKTNLSDTDSSDLDAESEISDDDERKNLMNKPNFNLKDHKTNAILNLLESSIIDLATVIEELSMQLKKSSLTRHIQPPLPSHFCKETAGGETFLGGKRIDECNCTSTCTECCEFCKELKRRKVSKIPRRQLSSGCKWNPIIHDEPFWMQSNPVKKPKFTEGGIENNKESSDKANKFHMFSKYFKNYEFDDVNGTKNNQNCRYHERQKKSDKRFEKIEEIRPSKLRERLSSGDLKLKRGTVKKGQYRTQKSKVYPKREKSEKVSSDVKCLSSALEILKRYKALDQKFTAETLEETESGSLIQLDRKRQNLTKSGSKNSQSMKDGKDLTEPELNPIYIKDLKDIICTEEKLGDKMSAFCLLPIVKDFDTPSDENDIFVNKSDGEDEDEEYPQTIIFHLEKFSNVLKNKFGKHLRGNLENTEKKESELILDLVIDSLEEAIDVFDDELYNETETSSNEVIDNNNKEKTGDRLKDVCRNAENISPFLIDADAPKLKFEHEKILQEMCQYMNQSNIKHQHLKGRDDEVVINFSGQNVSRACKMCLNMVEPSVCDCQEETTKHCKEECLTKTILKESCFICRNACERGLTIHQCHESIPSSLLEIRHMHKSGRICVCYLTWHRKKETYDWRWLKSPFHDLTRVELQRGTTADKETIVTIVYGPETTMLKESLAHTQLEVVHDFPGILQFGTSEICKTEEEICASKSFSENKLFEHAKKKGSNNVASLNPRERSLLTKICRFFDEIQKNGYGEGPPLIIKLRKYSVLYDAHDLLMVPSKINLHYYRSLRVIAIQDDEVPRTYTNFINQDWSDELFELFATQLFGPSEKRLFERPCEEATCVYPNPDSSAHPQWFVFAGAILALAFLHQKKMDIQLPMCLFKCLLDRPLRLHDLQEIYPPLYEKLIWMKENDISTCKDKITFAVEEKKENQTYFHDLMRNGSELAVTEKNKFKYIDFVVKWKLAERCLTQLKDFRSGFDSVLQPWFLTTFSEKELQTLIRQPVNGELIMAESSSGKLYKPITRRNTN